MASTHIYPVNATRLGNRATGLVSSLWQINAEMEFIKTQADQIATGGDWTSLAAEFGFASAADAETFYNLLAGAKTYYQASSNAIIQLMNRMG